MIRLSDSKNSDGWAVFDLLKTSFFRYNESISQEEHLRVPVIATRRLAPAFQSKSVTSCPFFKETSNQVIGPSGKIRKCRTICLWSYDQQQRPVEPNQQTGIHITPKKETAEQGCLRSSPCRPVHVKNLRSFHRFSHRLSFFNSTRLYFLRRNPSRCC